MHRVGFAIHGHVDYLWTALALVYGSTIWARVVHIITWQTRQQSSLLLLTANVAVIYHSDAATRPAFV